MKVNTNLKRNDESKTVYNAFSSYKLSQGRNYGDAKKEELSPPPLTCKNELGNCKLVTLVGNFAFWKTFLFFFAVSNSEFVNEYAKIANSQCQ